MNFFDGLNLLESLVLAVSAFGIGVLGVGPILNTILFRKGRR